MKRLLLALGIVVIFPMCAFAQAIGESVVSKLSIGPTYTALCPLTTGTGAPSGGATCAWYLDRTSGTLYTRLASGDWQPMAYLGVTNTFTAEQWVNTTEPAVRLIESDASTNNKQWRLDVNSEVLCVQTLNDASSILLQPMCFTRAGAATFVSTINTTGIKISGSAPSGHFLKGDATNFTDAAGSALTGVNDTNIGATFNAGAATALVNSAAITFTWTGTLAAARLNANVVQGVANDTNITGAISAQVLTLGFTGTLGPTRLNANVVQAVTNDTNVTGSIATQTLTLNWTGTLGNSRGGCATDVSAFATNGVLYKAASACAATAAGGANTVLVGGGVPSFSATPTVTTLTANTSVTTPIAKTASYVALTTGWQVDGSGNADFRSVFSNVFHAQQFISDEQEVRRCCEILATSGGQIHTAFTVPGLGSAVTSITRSGSTATVTLATATTFTTNKAYIAGANQSEYGGLQTITVSDSTHFTYTVSGTPATPATGTITALDTNTIDFDDMPEGPDKGLFNQFDELWIRTNDRTGGALIISEAFGFVINGDTSPSGYQTWQFVRHVSTDGGTMAAAMVVPVGTTVPDVGTTGQGVIESSVVGDTRLVSSITRSTTTATVTTSGAHGFTTGNIVLISGATPSGYNGAVSITVTGASTFTYTVSSGLTTPATGTILLNGVNGVNAPYIRIWTWTTSPILTNRSIRTQFGSLKGITGTVEYGMVAGTYASTNGSYIRVSDQNLDMGGITAKWWDGTTNVATISPNSGSPYLALGNPAPSSCNDTAGIILAWSHTQSKACLELYDGVASYFKFINGLLTWKSTNTELDASGNLITTGGTIGGWTLGATKLSAGSGANTVTLDSGGSNPAITAGSATVASAPFRVTQAGALHAESGDIGGWTINSAYLAKDTGTNATSSGFAPADYPIFVGSTYANRATAPLRATPAGAVTMTNATITGASGTVNINSNGLLVAPDTAAFSYATSNHGFTFDVAANSVNGFMGITGTTASSTNTVDIFATGGGNATKVHSTVKVEASNLAVCSVPCGPSVASIVIDAPTTASTASMTFTSNSYAFNVGAVTIANTLATGNVTIAGSASPTITFTPTSGSTVNGVVYQSGNSVTIGTASFSPLSTDINAGVTTVIAAAADTATLRIRKHGTTTDLVQLYEDGAGSGQIRMFDSAAAQKVHIETNGTTYFNGGDIVAGNGATSSALGSARITFDGTAGNVQVNLTSGGAGVWPHLLWNLATSGDNGFAQFGTEGRGSYTVRGSITYNRAGGLTAYNTTSDERSKTNIQDATDVGALLRQLAVKTFDWRETGNHSLGLIAQPTYKIAPWAVTVGTDELKPNGLPENPWGISYPAFVPWLIRGWQQHDSSLTDLAAAVRDLTILAANLKSEVAVLEATVKTLKVK